MTYTRQWLSPVTLRECCVDEYVNDVRSAEYQIYWAVVEGNVRARHKGRLLTSEEIDALRDKHWSDNEHDLFALPADIELSVEDAKRIWGQSSNQQPGFSAQSLKTASNVMVTNTIRSVYNAVPPGGKPPNIKELSALVLRILNSQGFCASKRSIEQIGGAEEFERRRWPPGKRVRSEQQGRRK